ncbi:MAG: type II toxin-antitoxin system RelE/ParE family toxin [Campylobacterota bacterium]|nr:type II toxin-antitoxin system RelE/ParE family toxin [Campylobacterota bacterium]
MTVRIDDKAIKDLFKVHKAEAKKILSKIEELEKFPQVPNIKKLTNFEPPYRLRVGNYRVLFDIEDNDITVYRVKHRKESYK